ncbi:hypothetical protein KUV23_17915 [Algoriphagus marincola]|uniref:SPW repeat-containing protein n=1 Tax=Algoriphagus marincola TaxID=264027 RepID=A0ABS7N950_9BACT|nr:hypothetical protein [Algoriphagus marincola]MBY5952863.1 hypothetical protein [Algoriphagus marincola]
MVNIIQRKSLEIPLIIMGVLVVTSFIPIIQILILTLNGGIMYLFSLLLGGKELVGNFLLAIEGFISLVGLILFYKSIKISWRIFSVIFTLLFLLPLMVYIFGFIETDIYFVQNLVAGFAVGLILLVVALLKKNPADV